MFSTPPGLPKEGWNTPLPWLVSCLPAGDREEKEAVSPGRQACAVMQQGRRTRCRGFAVGMPGIKAPLDLALAV